MLEKQEFDSVTKLQLVQPLPFGDMVLCYHRKIKCLILATNCRYHNIFEPLINTVMATSAIEAHFRYVGEYQNKVKLKFSTFSRQHFPCTGPGRFW